MVPLKHLDADLRPVLEAGVIEALVGTNADRARLHRLTAEIHTIVATALL